MGDFAVTSDTVHTVFAPAPLANVTVAQSFAFDHSDGTVYTLQLMEGGIQLKGEDAPVAADVRRQDGDLCLSHLTRSGVLRGSMYLKGFGHGVALGVQPRSGTPYIWTECGARHSKDGYGTAITRFPFSDQAVLDTDNLPARSYQPVPGSLYNAPAVDFTHNRLVLGYTLAGEFRYAVYDLTDFTAGVMKPLYDVSRAGFASDETFQGYTLFGPYIYQITGNPYPEIAGESDPTGGGNTYLSAIDIQSGELAGRRKVTAAPALSYREPEGVAVTTASGGALCTGFASGTGGARLFSVYGFGTGTQ
ncbi:teichoic acid biosynthesis protein C [Streptomyces fractus]|uniref:phage baseplate protein n=1 Tax=Streptomyces fractus TaxID=641806 RepID=UPI003CF28B75